MFSVIELKYFLKIKKNTLTNLAIVNSYLGKRYMHAMILFTLFKIFRNINFKLSPFLCNHRASSCNSISGE